MASLEHMICLVDHIDVCNG